MNTNSRYTQVTDLSILSGRLFRAELALHDAELSGDATWIGAAVERLMEAVASYASARDGHTPVPARAASREPVSAASQREPVSAAR